MPSGRAISSPRWMTRRQRQDLQAASDALDAAQYGLTSARERGGGDTDGRAAIVTAEAAVQDAQRRLDTARDALAPNARARANRWYDPARLRHEKGVYNQGQELVQIANLAQSRPDGGHGRTRCAAPRRQPHRERSSSMPSPARRCKGTLVVVAPLADKPGRAHVYEGNVTVCPPARSRSPARHGCGRYRCDAHRAATSSSCRTSRWRRLARRPSSPSSTTDGSRERVEVRTGIRAQWSHRDRQRRQ